MLSPPETAATPTFEIDDATSGHANVLLAAMAGVLWVVDWVVCSSSDNTHDANLLRITINDVQVFRQDFMANDTTPVMFEFPNGFYGSVGQSLRVRLTLPTGAVGKLSVRYR